jgi:hypothetical protein
MPKQSYALEPNGPKRLQISWGTFWKNITVTLDGSLIGTIPDQKALRQGRQFTLPDGSTLSVQFSQNLAGAELRVLRNGQPLPGSASDPESRLKVAAGVIFFVTGLNILLGLIAVFFQVDFLLQLGLGWFSVIFGLVFLFLGIFTQRRSQVALIIAIVLFGLDGLLGIVGAVMAGYAPSIPGLFMRILLLIPMIQGVSAIKQLKQQEGG